MRWITVMCAGLLGCAPSSELEPVAQVRQALPGVPQHVGEPGSRLGSSMATCPGGGFVSGAPGTGTAWFSSSGTPAPIGNELGRTVACESVSGTVFMLAGGDAGVRRAFGGSWVPALSMASTLSISRSDEASLPLLVGGVGKVHFYDSTTGIDTNTGITNPGGFGSVVMWVGATPRFLVSAGGGPTVQRYLFNPLNDTATLNGSFTKAVAGFGRALAVGNLLPFPGDEVAIAAQGQVLIFSTTSVLLMQLSGSESSFGTSLGIQRDYAVGLDALLVGEPTLDRVHRFVGDAGAVISSSTAQGSMFGASLAVDSMNDMAIGAPLFQGNGAVYLEPLPGNVRVGEVRECVAGALCRTSTCVTGVCVGGALCDTTTGTGASACDPGDRCVVGVCVRDAGVMFDAGVDAGVFGDAGVDAGIVPSVDAGIRDAGPGKDAGSSDAGEVDAGVTTGPLIFSTSGCSQGGALPMLLLALAMLRRPVA